MDIKQVAMKVGVTPDQIRRWERLGMIPPIMRDQNGIRNFKDRDVEWLKYAKLLNEMDVSPDFQIEYVKLVELGKQATPARQDLINEQLDKLKDEHQCLLDRIKAMDTEVAKRQSA